MKYQALKWDVRDNPDRPGEKSIGIITMNRPEVMNAYNEAVGVGLQQAFDQVAADEETRVVVLTGAGAPVDASPRYSIAVIDDRHPSVSILSPASMGSRSPSYTACMMLFWEG